MKEFPHHYLAASRAGAEGDVTVTSPGLPDLTSDSPAEFGGSGVRWSPETLLCGAVADCFLLTFRAVARASKLPFAELTCDVTGRLDKVERTTSFTSFELRARLTVPAGTDEARAHSLLEKAERACLISRSLSGSVALVAEVVTLG
jgi:organic hydroperoxide reductase OsmC/OhrA